MDTVGDMMKKKNKKKWIKPRHYAVRTLLGWTLGVYTKLKYNIKIEPFKKEGKRAYLILLNHQTAFDQFFVGLAFKKPVYYLASEDLFSNGFSSSLIKYLVEPIPIRKQTTDVKAVLNCIRVAKEGGTIAIAPEGNRTFSGKTEYMNSSIASLARKLGMPIALYRIEGGYGAHPRWSDVVRRGKMKGYVSEVIEPDEYKDMSDEALFVRIKNGLYVNEAVADCEFKHKRLAEYLERAMYVCPDCGLSEFESNLDIIECKKCGKQIRYTPTKELCGVGFDFPFRFVNDWYEYQSKYINGYDVTQHKDAPMYEDTVSLKEVIVFERKIPLADGVKLSLYGDRITMDTQDEVKTLTFDEISSVVVLGKNKLNIYFCDKLYQINGSKRFNALKYVHIYHRYKNIIKGDENEQFLGL